MTFSNNTPNTKTIVAGSILSLWVSQGFGDDGTLSKYRTTEHCQNMEGNRGTKLYKLDDENMVSRSIKRGTNEENVREHGNTG